MIDQIKKKISMAAFLIPAYAAENPIQITSGDTQIQKLTTLQFANILKGAISFVFIIVAVVFFFILVIGGLKWITSGGDEKKVASARAQITNALIGLVIVFAAWAITRLIGTVFGVDLLGQFTIPTFQ